MGNVTTVWGRFFLCFLVALAALPRLALADEIGVILLDNPDNFFRSLERGVRNGARDLGVRLLVRTPRGGNEADTSQLNVVNFLIERKVSAIVLVPGPMEGVSQPISLPVPLILVDRDGPQFKAQSVVSTDNFNAGRKAGLNLVKSLPNRASVVLFRLAPDIPSTTQREEGFLSVAREQGWQVKFDGFVGFNPRHAEAVMSAALSKLSGSVDAVFAPNESVATEATHILSDLPPQSRPHLVTFDWKPAFRQALEDGVLDFTILQDPEGMGYRAVQVAAEARGGRTVPDRVFVETTLVTKGNLDEPAIRSAISAYEAQ